MRLLYPAGPSVATEQTTNNKQQLLDYSAYPDFFVGPIGLFEIWRSAIKATSFLWLPSPLQEQYETVDKENPPLSSVWVGHHLNKNRDKLTLNRTETHLSLLIAGAFEQYWIKPMKNSFKIII